MAVPRFPAIDRGRAWRKARSREDPHLMGVEVGGHTFGKTDSAAYMGLTAKGMAVPFGRHRFQSLKTSEPIRHAARETERSAGHGKNGGRLGSSQLAHGGRLTHSPHSSETRSSMVQLHSSRPNSLLEKCPASVGKYLLGR